MQVKLRRGYEMVKTPEWFESIMMNTANIVDNEYSHRHADMVMCELLRELGYSAGVDIFDGIQKEY